MPKLDIAAKKTALAVASAYNDTETQRARRIRIVLDGVPQLARVIFKITDRCSPLQGRYQILDLPFERGLQGVFHGSRQPLESVNKR